MKRAIRILLILFAIGCSSQKDHKVIHPTSENLPSENNGNIIPAGEIKVKENDSIGRKLLSGLEHMQEISSIGELYGAQEEMFGSIEDIVIDSFHRIYILDADKQLIQVFSQEGAYITSVGGKGAGPGEFERARSMATYNDEWLLVSNGYRIEVYDIKGKEIKFLKTLPLDEWAYSITMCRGKLFVHNSRLFDLADETEGKDYVPMIRAYDVPSFKPLFLFGQSYKSTNPTVVGRLSSGNISCNESSSTVILAFEKMPVLHGYSAEDGHLKWKSLMDGLHSIHIIQSNEGRRTSLMYQVPDSHIIDRIAPSVSVKDGYEIVQVRRRILPEQGYESRGEVLTFLLNSSNGKGWFLSKNIPGITDISNGVIATISDDFMASRIYKFRFQGY